MKKIYLLSLLFPISLTACQVGQYEDDSKRLGLLDNFEIKDTLPASEEHVKVVLLYGQSNASGVSSNSYLEKKYPVTYSLFAKGIDQVMINFNADNFGNYSSGFMNVSLSQGTAGGHFGPEIGIAEKMKSGYEGKTFIIKYSVGGTTLCNQWLNGKGGRGGLYNCSMKMTKLSLDYLVSKGYKLDIAGICWMQGENDAYFKYKGYYDCTKKLASYYRNDLKEYDDSIKFIDACISEYWSDYETVNADKKKFANESNDNYVVDTISMKLTTNTEPENNPDIAHYDSTSMILLGRAFGDYLLK